MCVTEKFSNHWRSNRSLLFPQAYPKSGLKISSEHLLYADTAYIVTKLFNNSIKYVILFQVKKLRLRALSHLTKYGRWEFQNIATEKFLAP
jgi:hypothetical protein